MQSVNGLLRKLGQGGIGIGAGGPLAEKGGVPLVHAGLSAQRMGKSEIPAVGRNGTEGFFAIPVRFFRKREGPGLAEIGSRRMRLGLLLDERLHTVGA